MWCRVLVVAILVVAGCGNDSPRQSISGTVTLNGQPVDVGTIRFVPQQGNSAPAVGASIVKGSYRLGVGEGPIPGDYRVVISSPKQGDKEVVVIPGEAPGYETIETIPAEYNTKSSLTVTVSQGRNHADFELTSAGGK